MVGPSASATNSASKAGAGGSPAPTASGGSTARGWDCAPGGRSRWISVRSWDHTQTGMGTEARITAGALGAAVPGGPARSRRPLPGLVLLLFFRLPLFIALLLVLLDLAQALVDVAL